MYGQGNSTHSVTETLAQLDEAAVLESIVASAESNGHSMVPLPQDAPVAPGVFAKCSQCSANLRYYFGRAGGEAYITMCNIAPQQQEPATPYPESTPEDYANYTLNDWRDEIMEYARLKGWLTTPEDANVGDLVALMHTELSELYEEYRNNRQPNETYYTPDKPGKPEGIPSELADVIIRALHFAGVFSIDIHDMVREKHEYNLTRPYRHGGKRS